jgi:hypothetical protein
MDYEWFTNMHESEFGEFRSECVCPLIVKGPPRATSIYSADNLRRRGMIGVYKPLYAAVTTQETYGAANKTGLNR